jgi:ribonucleoside-diphosphate reductase alpha chain
MSERERLSDRRNAEVFDFDHGDRRWTATISRFRDGRVAEIFLDGPKDSVLVEMAKETALTASLALQCGCPLATLRHALTGRHAGPLGAALAAIDEGAT